MAQNTLDIVSEHIHAALISDGLSDVVVTPRSGFYQLGLSSIRLAELTDELNEIFEDTVEVTDFFDLADVQMLADEIDRRICEQAAA